MGYLIPKFDTNNLHTVIWSQVFLSNTNNSYICICYKVTISSQ